MNPTSWRWWRRLPGLLAAPPHEPAQRQRRILALQRDVVLPAKLVVIGVVFYYLFFSRWVDVAVMSYGVVLETMQQLFTVYLFLNLSVAVAFFVVRQFPVQAVQWLVFTLGLADGLLLGGLTLLTGGFDSVLYWVFPGLILLNAVCIPLAMPQIVLNLALSALFLAAGLLEEDYRATLSTTPSLRPRSLRKPRPPLTPEEIHQPAAVLARLQERADPLARLVWSRLTEAAQQRLADLDALNTAPSELAAVLAEEFNRMTPGARVVQVAAEPEVHEAYSEPFVSRLLVLWLFTFCCYGVQVLAARHQRAEEEQQELRTRTEQLRSAGRLTAEFAHQIKNPLAIINNAAFCLQRALREGRGDPFAQTLIIREEVEKADRIITQVMGYAQLSEGRVEKLDLAAELDRALERVFPPGQCSTEVRRDYDRGFPPLLMQRSHLVEILLNLLQNAREAVGGAGHVTVTARTRPDEAVELTVADDGPGIAPDKLERVFEAYYTTRPKGTGLGLAIVKHNVELYGGTVQVASELGKGARFTVALPARTTMHLEPPA